MIKPDWWIREMAKKGMIEPFEERLVREGVISYGLSSFGYDLRAAPEWRIFTNVFSTVVDPKGFDPKSFVEYEGEEVIIPPNSFALTRSIEYIRMPENVIAIALGKSTYARCGIVANVTPLEPGWEVQTGRRWRAFFPAQIRQPLWRRRREPSWVSWRLPCVPTPRGAPPALWATSRAGTWPPRGEGRE